MIIGGNKSHTADPRILPGGQKTAQEACQVAAANSAVGISRTANFQAAASGQGSSGSSRMKNFIGTGQHPLMQNTSVVNGHNQM